MAQSFSHSSNVAPTTTQIALIEYDMGNYWGNLQNVKASLLSMAQINQFFPNRIKPIKKKDDYLQSVLSSIGGVKKFTDINVTIGRGRNSSTINIPTLDLGFNNNYVKLLVTNYEDINAITQANFSWSGTFIALNDSLLENTDASPNLEIFLSKRDLFEVLNRLASHQPQPIIPDGLCAILCKNITVDNNNNQIIKYYLFVDFFKYVDTGNPPVGNYVSYADISILTRPGGGGDGNGSGFRIPS